jgi:hypothetical protein
MEKSTSIKNIASALLLFHMKVETIKKDANNPFFKSKYASLSNILENIQTALSESGLAFTQVPTGEGGLTTMIMHAESGEYIMGEYIMKPVKNDPQGIGSAITYQRRYALCAVLGLNIEEDDDGNNASGKTDDKKRKDEGNENGLPWLNEGTPEFKGAVEKMKAGKSSVDALKKYFRISKKVEEKLNSESKKSVNGTTA